MRLVCGVVHEGEHRILIGDATPTLENMREAEGLPILPGIEYGWGEAATNETRVATAYRVLTGAGVHITEADRVQQAFADSVVVDMRSGEMWVLSVEEIMEWVSRELQKYRVA